MKVDRINRGLGVKVALYLQHLLRAAGEEAALVEIRRYQELSEEGAREECGGDFRRYRWLALEDCNLGSFLVMAHDADRGIVPQERLARMLCGGTGRIRPAPAGWQHRQPQCAIEVECEVRRSSIASVQLRGECALWEGYPVAQIEISSRCGYRPLLFTAIFRVKMRSCFEPRRLARVDRPRGDLESIELELWPHTLLGAATAVAPIKLSVLRSTAMKSESSLPAPVSKEQSAQLSEALLELAVRAVPQGAARVSSIGSQMMSLGIEVGEVEMSLDEVLSLVPGSVITIEVPAVLEGTVRVQGGRWASVALEFSPGSLRLVVKDIPVPSGGVLPADARLAGNIDGPSADPEVSDALNISQKMSNFLPSTSNIKQSG